KGRKITDLINNLYHTLFHTFDNSNYFNFSYLIPYVFSTFKCYNTGAQTRPRLVMYYLLALLLDYSVTTSEYCILISY
ncbi:hypothetical protein L9F63_016566, partial [Diploptera punctata]